MPLRQMDQRPWTRRRQKSSLLQGRFYGTNPESLCFQCRISAAGFPDPRIAEINAFLQNEPNPISGHSEFRISQWIKATPNRLNIDHAVCIS